MLRVGRWVAVDEELSQEESEAERWPKERPRTALEEGQDVGRGTQRGNRGRAFAVSSSRKRLAHLELVGYAKT